MALHRPLAEQQSAGSGQSLCRDPFGGFPASGPARFTDCCRGRLLPGGVAAGEAARGPNKGGLSAEDLQRNWSGLLQLPALRISGLMTMAPQGLAPKERRQLFSDCSQLADQLGLGECSMGMSGDWQEAAASGSTWLRLGSAVFGPRQMPTTGIG